MTTLVKLISGIAVVAALMVHVASAQEDDFRVETDVFVANKSEPIQQTLTLFAGGVAYDISRDKPSEITMVDVKRERIVMLDTERKLQTLISISELNALMESAKNQAASSALAVYLSDAHTKVIDDSNQRIVIGDKILKYEATLQSPRSPSMAIAYARFADASAYLNSWRAQSPPPFARVELNKAVEESKSLPKEIKRTTVGKDQSETFVVTCLLHPNWRLSRADQEQVARIGEMLTQFETVSAAQFFQLEAAQQPVVAASHSGK